MEPLVSIITPTRNNREMLARAIASIEGQSYSNIEHVIVDAMSADGTGEVVAEYQKRSPRRVIHVREPDNGMYEAVNKGIRRAAGRIIGILNSDDCYHPGTVARVVEHFRETGAGAVCGSIRLVARGAHDGAAGRTWVAQPDKMRSHMSIPHPGVFVAADVYRQWGGFDERYEIAADYEFLLRLRNAGVKMVTLDADVCLVRAGGMSQTRLWRSAVETFRAQRRHVGGIGPAILFGRRLVEYFVLSRVAAALQALGLRSRDLKT